MKITYIIVFSNNKYLYNNTIHINLTNKLFFFYQQKVNIISIKFCKLTLKKSTSILIAND